MGQPGVIFYFDILPALEKMEPEDVANIFIASLRYAQYGENPDFKGITSIVWELIRPRIERDTANYQEASDKSAWMVYRREAKKRGENLLEFDEWKRLRESQDNAGYPMISTDNAGYPMISTDNTGYPTTTTTTTTAIDTTTTTTTAIDTTTTTATTTTSKGADKPPARSPSEKKTKDKPERHRHGSYRNVLLTDDELEKLKTEFPADWSGRIEKLSCYMESSGKTYKSHLATIRNWANREKQEAKSTQAPEAFAPLPGVTYL